MQNLLINKLENFTIEVNYCDCVRIQVGYLKFLCNGQKKNFSKHFIVVWKSLWQLFEKNMHESHATFFSCSSPNSAILRSSTLCLNAMLRYAMQFTSFRVQVQNNSLNRVCGTTVLFMRGCLGIGKLPWIYSLWFKIQIQCLIL